MAKGIHAQIKNRIDGTPEGAIIMTSDFSDIASLPTIRKSLGRLTEENILQRVLDGIYLKPKYSEFLCEYVPADPDAVARAIAEHYHWTIAPCGDIALNILGLSTQVPAVWTYISDGPYREFRWDKIVIKFRHRTNRGISMMAEKSIMVTEAIRTLGKDNINPGIIETLRSRLSDSDKKLLMEDAKGTSAWIYEVIKKVCIRDEKNSDN